MRFLVDGYNLLHAIGLLNGPVPPHGLMKARAALFGMVASAHRENAHEVTIVFDARGAPAGSDAEEFHGGIRVLFAHREEADDRIETLIAAEGVPKRLTVVSDDHRLRKAALRRACVSWKCGDYLDHLERLREVPMPPRAAPLDKPTSVSPGDAARWLREFGDVQGDPEFKEFFDDFGGGI